MSYTKKTTSNSRDYYQQVTDDIIKAIEEGTTPWQQGWDNSVGAQLSPRPFNGATNRRYARENFLRLMIDMKRKNSADPRFFTYNQAKEQGYQIRKGAHGTVVKMQWRVEKDKDGNELPEDEKYWAKRYCNVFHATDCCLNQTYVKDENGKQQFAPVYDDEGKPVMRQVTRDGKEVMEPLMQPVMEFQPIPEYVPKTQGYTHEEKCEIAEAMLTASGAKIFNDQASSAFYQPGTDEIHLPKREAFPDLTDYYATALHELAHWTGHESRLNRIGMGNMTKGSPTYAKEELRAELASTFLAADLGLPVNTMNHAAYVESWIAALKNDKTEIFKAANEAMKIKNYLEKPILEKLKELDKKAQQREEINSEQDKGAQEQPEAAKTSNAPAKQPFYIAIHQLKEGDAYHLLRFATWDEAQQEAQKAKQPLDFRSYDCKWQETKDMGEVKSLSDLLNNVYEEHNQDSRASGTAMHALSASDIVQVNERYFYVDGAGFQEVSILPYKDKELMKPRSTDSVKQLIEDEKKAVGAENYNRYHQMFQQEFYEGWAGKEADSQAASVPSYQEFLFESAGIYQLSSLNPADQKGWEAADTAFLENAAKASCEQHGYVDAADVGTAKMSVYKLSPYTAVVPDAADYAKKIFDKVMDSPYCQEHKAPQKAKEQESQAVR